MDKCDMRSNAVGSFIKRFSQHLCLTPNMSYPNIDYKIEFPYRGSTISIEPNKDYSYLTITVYIERYILMVVVLNILDDGIIRIHDKKSYDIYYQKIPLIEIYKQKENHCNPYEDIIKYIDLGITEAIIYTTGCSMTFDYNEKEREGV